MYQAVIFSFKVSQNFIFYESAEDGNLRAIFNRVKKKNIILQYFYRIVLQLECLTYNSKGFGRATIWRGAAFHFLAVFSKMKILWKLWLWFSKMFHQRVLSDWKWSISKFQFWRRILDIYRQPLLSYQTVASRCLPEQSFHGVIKTFILLSGKNKLELLPFSLYSEMFNRRAAALKPSLFSKGVFVIFLHPPPPSLPDQ